MIDKPNSIEIRHRFSNFLSFILFKINFDIWVRIFIFCIFELY